VTEIGSAAWTSLIARRIGSTRRGGSQERARRAWIARVAGVRIVEDDVHLARRRTANASTLKVPNHADDSVRHNLERHSATDRITSTELPLRHRLVENRDGPSGLEILSVDVAAAKQVCADGVKEVRPDAIE
jgi:hypothetical protein